MAFVELLTKSLWVPNYYRIYMVFALLFYRHAPGGTFYEIALAPALLLGRRGLHEDLFGLATVSALRLRREGFRVTFELARSPLPYLWNSHRFRVTIYGIAMVSYLWNSLDLIWL